MLWYLKIYIKNRMLNKIPGWALILLPALFFWLAWPPMPLFFLLFFAFVPLFELEKRCSEQSAWRFFRKLYIALFLWNAAITWWVWNSTAWGAVVMLVFNSLFMAIPWMLMRLSRKYTTEKRAGILFILFWLLFEHLHQNWDLSWPWLTLGNGFANTTWFVQWYEFTGTLGGSFVVLALNLIIFYFLSSFKKIYAATAVIIFAFLGLLSVVLKKAGNFNSNNYIKVAVLQPSFDPWHEKFHRDPADMIREMLDLSKTKIDSTTDLLVWPETSLVDNIDLHSRELDYQVRQLRSFQMAYPKLSILTGADMQQLYFRQQKRPNSTARPTADKTTWWDAFNSALYLKNDGKSAYYHKSKLVPGTEQMPLTNWFPAINDLAVKLDENSMTGSLGKTDSVVLFGEQNITPAICYESIYGDYLAKFAQQGAGIIAVITNDAWWGKTPGYRQHLAYARLRAIEQRKWLVRSANTGTSCFIDPEGNIHEATPWYSKTCITKKLSINYDQTFYVKLGDNLVLFLLFLLCMVWFFLHRGKK